MSPRFTRLVQGLPALVPFTGPEALERRTGRLFKARLGANESVFGPSPKAIAAMEAAVRDTWKYADPESHDLRHALALHHGVQPANIMVGEGIDALLGYVVRLVVDPGDAVVTSDGAYPTFNFHVAGYGGTLHKVPYRDDSEDPSALIAKAREMAPKLIYFANPDNPMGTWHPPETVTGMVRQVPDGSLLVLDEAYVDFAPLAPVIDPDDPRVIRMRTFSKAYGMAGARIGYAIGAPDLIAAFDKVRNHFGMARTSQIGALTALQDQDWLADVKARVAAARDQIAAIAQANGLVAIRSATNFVAIDCEQDAAFAIRVLSALQDHGVFIRKPFVAPQDRCIRISAGRPTDLDLLAEILPLALNEARDGT